MYYLGESPEVDRCFVAAGFNSVGIQSAGGVGWVLADWIVDDHPPMDLSVVDIRRSFGFQCEPAYLDARIPESLGLLYAMHWPFRQYETARNIRQSPLHDRIDAAGAVFGEVGGWERPNWFAEPGQERVYHYSWGPQNWFKASGVECEAVRNAVGLFDQTSFAKFTVEGPDAMALLNWVSGNEVDVPVGRSVYSQWLNDHGGIEADLTMTRRGENSYWVVTSAGSAPRDWAWLRRAARGRNVELCDVTDQYAVLGLMGPNSREVLSALCDADLGNDGFPFGTAQDLCVAGAEVLALRMTYVGELGWELYVPRDQAVALYDAMVDAGTPLGLRPAGYHAMNSLRMEAGYCHWGHDITDEDTPLEAGLGFAVAWDKQGGFRGREALAAQREMPRAKRLVKFRLEDPEWLLYHDEPIYREGQMVGRTSSGMWSYTEGGRWPWAMWRIPTGYPKTGWSRCHSKSRWLDGASPPPRHFVPSTIPAKSGFDSEGKERPAVRDEVQVVIIGGGAMGAGLFYFLAHEGWTDTVLVEKGELCSGSTWHAAGLIPHFIGSLNMAKCHQVAPDLYDKHRSRDRAGQRLARHRRHTPGP